MRRNLSFFFIFLLSIVFFWQFLVKGLLPIPSDTIVGLYHPFRDIYAKDYPRGIPFKNFLITDPVRQQYPWRNLSIELEKKMEIPLWNPYTFSGTPLLANLQSGVFYPLNLILLILPFNLGWSVLIFLETILASIFMMLYLSSLKINRLASFLGSAVFAFSGFSIAWLEWGTILHVALWLPLILLSIDRIFNSLKLKTKTSKLFWPLIFIFSFSSAFFAGHLQTFFYLFLISLGYLLARWFQYGKNKKIIFQFTIFYLVFAILTAIQWIPTIQFISESGRSIDQLNWQKDGWFIPWQHLVQFLAPDFFGNPTTLNYWGVFNYGEFIGYIGVFSLIMVLFALFFRRDKKTLFFGTLFFLSLIFSLPTMFAKIPYLLNTPLLASSQPTRLLFITDFSLAILTALGFDMFLRNKKAIFFVVFFITAIFGFLWAFTVFGTSLFPMILKENLIVSQRNLILPTLILILSIGLVYLSIFLKTQRLKTFVYFALLLILTFDLLRFGLKFNPFTDKKYLFPQSKALAFIKDDKSLFRVMTDDSRIFAPNFSIIYKIQSVDGYDPLYLQRYGELIAASERDKPDISPPFGFNRIITPHNFDSKIMDLLGVKYVLSLNDLTSAKLEKVYQEGETRVFKNRNVYPRTFFVKNVLVAKDKNDAIKKMFDIPLDSNAVVEDPLEGEFGVGNSRVVEYRENKIVIETENDKEGFLVLVETYYPTWRAKVDKKEVKIYRTDFNFRGVLVPKGKHIVEFSNYLI